ncbi:MBL fold metallo-hydrolase [Thalassorhabdus alkalitolerans]|uniref:MBL fold metallo-hydrolase n=1 Tax=Thalassorhabdus alkalitolerans TaxID=2282697 RepID=A0ABW0YJ74_9BACI
MNLKKIKEGCSCFASPVNIGYVQKNETGLLIDAGIDASVSKKAVKQLKEKGLPLTDVLITHAHTDHFGGAGWIAENEQVRVWAESFERQVLEQPKLEPVYLFQGNEPPKEMRNKFLEGPAVSVTHSVEEGTVEIGSISGEVISLPGHSHGQIGFRVDGILYAGDSYFAPLYLEKHKIPFMVDKQAAVSSLKKLLTLDVQGAVPGHGHYEENFKITVSKNIDFHQRVEDDLLFLLRTVKQISLDELIGKFCENKGIIFSQLGSWALYRTAVTAYVMSLVNEEHARLTFERNQLMITAG